ncbi:MAG: phosphoglucomutase/phosphomannomutase family protein [Endomicrobium sp.]|jgi:alpha-D-glucose phosphate-specific phosphoglucomutase|uniref:phosphoglucomutase/phosphomannomutase family protein n=1 Tax=Candidatus Endomicrobiellum cubanum TaxID=3242325 RepID=UPI002829D0BD|nr:phosphoglucomutase/phosphomannomutase family protein [Endomicrobium sp.]
MIKFGTSGWRGIIAKDFTYDNIAIVSQSIANIINENRKERPASVIIGYDTRFMSEDFATSSSEILAGNGIKVLFCKRDTPTPVIAYDIVNSKLTGGINFTASHNPYKYNGLKYSPSWGGPALPETTEKIEKYCASLKSKDIKYISFETGIKNKIIEIHNPSNGYIKKIKELVNFKALKKSKIKVAVDVLHGTGNGYLDTLLEMAGIKNITINKNRDVMFNNGAPEPSENNLKDLINLVKKESYKLGFSTDGDADRFAIIDYNGTFITPNQVISILLYHLNKTRGWTGIVARSVMTTHLIDKIGAKIGTSIEETPVGFKYIGDIMVNNPDKFIIGGEESGGLTIRGHIPEKDGILACLLVAEALAMSKKSVTELLKDIKKITGEVITSRLNFHLEPEVMEAFKDKLKNKIPNTFAGIKIKKYVNIDGDKFILDDNNWIGFRLSGTEPVVRLYAESDSQTKLNKLLKEGKNFIYGR